MFWYWFLFLSGCFTGAFLFGVVVSVATEEGHKWINTAIGIHRWLARRREQRRAERARIPEPGRWRE
jgi:uncharacterized protein (DUF2062 family)